MDALKEKENLIKTIQDAEALKKLALAEKAKTDLYFLDKHVLGYDLMTPHTHGGLCAVVESLLGNPQESLDKFNLLERHFEYSDQRDAKMFKTEYTLEDFQKRFRLILMPRGSFKSTVVTIGAVLQILLVDPNARILIDSETFDKSRAFIAEVKGHLEDSHYYREIFMTVHGVYPDARKSKDKWTDTELNIAAKRRKTKEPNLSAAGVGVTKVGMHYDYIISDDLHSEKNVTTRDAIRAVVDHYKLNLSLLEPTGAYIVIGTRWDYNDVYQYIADNESHRFTIYARQAIMPDGSIIFPERLTQQFLEDQKRSQGLYHFSCQYQNMPIDDETATFKASQMIRIPDEDIKDKPINWFLMCDPAISQEKTADYTAFVVAGLDYQRNIYVKQVLRGRFTPSEIVDNIFRLYEEYQPKAIGLETVAFQKTLQYAIKDRMKEQGWWLPLKEVKRKTKQSKEERIRGLQPAYEYGHIFHLSSCSFIDDLEYELTHFPRGQNDDMIDALADVLEIGFPPSSRQANNQEKRVRPSLLKKLWKPRSNITGY